MDFNLSKEQTLIQQMVRNFTENEVKPVAAETDRTVSIPVRTLRSCSHGIMGIISMCVPKEYGGPARTTCPPPWRWRTEQGMRYRRHRGHHNGLCCDPILRNGTGLRSRSICGCSQEDTRWALCSDRAQCRFRCLKGTTTARLEGDHYVLNGSKVFITNGYVADVIVVFAMTDPPRAPGYLRLHR